MPRAAFAHVETWVFDLDNTLYPPAIRLFDQIERRMTDYVMRALGVAAAEADALRAPLLAELRHDARRADARARARPGPLPRACPRHRPDRGGAGRRSSARRLGRLRGRKVVYTNGSREHARRVTKAIGLEGAFDALYGFEDAAYVPKPEAAAFATVFALDGLDAGRGRRCSRTTTATSQVPHRLGMRTVLVGPAGRPSARPPPDRRSRRLPRARRVMRHAEADVLVAGGGVAGLTAAAAFASAGFRVLCVDPVPPVTSADAEGADLRSTAFLMPALALLDRAGLGARLEPHAAPLRVMRIVDAGGAAGSIRTTADFAAEEAGSDIFGWNLPNWLLRREMVARLAELPSAELRAGGTRRAGHAAHRRRDRRALGRRPGARGAGDRGRRPRQRGAPRPGDRRAALGLRPEGAGLRRRPRPAARRGLDRDPPLRRPVHPGAAARPRRRRRIRRWSGWRAARGPRRSPRCPATAFAEAATERSCGLLGPLRPAGPRGLWPIVSQVADRLDGPRTALVAEAAHVVPPIGAQGLNMSLRDIATLLDLALEARAAGADIGAAGAARALPPGPAPGNAAARRRHRRAQPGGNGRRAAAARPPRPRPPRAARHRAAAPRARCGSASARVPRADKPTDRFAVPGTRLGTRLLTKP